MGVKNYINLGDTIIGERSLGGQRENYAADALGSVTGTLVEGAIENTYGYKPYGDGLVKTGVGPDPIFRWGGINGYQFTGRSSAEYYVRSRQYSSEKARWTTVDPLWPLENAYGYVRATPTTQTDPTGLSPCFGDPSSKLSCPATHDACTKHKRDICGYARVRGIDDNDLGGVVCCEGKKTVCAWKRNFPKNSNPDDWVLACTRHHEEEHITAKCSCEPKPFGRCALPHGLAKKSECSATSNEVRCLARARNKNCKGAQNLSQCLYYYNWHMCGRCYIIADPTLYGCTSMPVECGVCYDNSGKHKY